MKNEARPGSPVRGSRTGRPVMAALDLLGRRGTLRILWELREGGALTFRALASAAELPPATLNARLSELRALSLVRADDGYTLTVLGCELMSALRSLDTWSKRWVRQIELPPHVEPVRRSSRAQRAR
jgi:DNA-binding HxlR family transcriptional regulator